MKVVWPNGESQVFMDADNSPYLTVPNRVGAMCLNQYVFDWWARKVADPKCHHYLEIGSFDGVMLSLMAEANPKVEFFAIDPFIEAGSTGPGHYGYWYINNKNLANVTLYFGKSEEHLPKVIETGHKFSAIFIDGDHSYETLKNDLEKSWQLLEVGGFMACHDHHMPDVIRACQEFSATCPFVEEVGMPVFYKL